MFYPNNLMIQQDDSTEINTWYVTLKNMYILLIRGIKIYLYMGCQTHALSDSWDAGLMCCMTHAVSGSWDVGLVRCRTRALSDSCVVGLVRSRLMGCRTHGV